MSTTAKKVAAAIIDPDEVTALRSRIAELELELEATRGCLACHEMRRQRQNERRTVARQQMMSGTPASIADHLVTLRGNTPEIVAHLQLIPPRKIGAVFAAATKSDVAHYCDALASARVPRTVIETAKLYARGIPRSVRLRSVRYSTLRLDDHIHVAAHAVMALRASGITVRERDVEVSDSMRTQKSYTVDRLAMDSRDKPLLVSASWLASYREVDAELSAAIDAGHVEVLEVSED